MTTPAHIQRHVYSTSTIDISSNHEEILHQIEQTLAHGIHWAIVMTSECKILVATTAHGFEEYAYAEDRSNAPQALATTLQCFGFFTSDAPPSSVPLEIVTPRDGENRHYRVEISAYPLPRKTHYRLMK